MKTKLRPTSTAGVDEWNPLAISAVNCSFHPIITVSVQEERLPEEFTDC